MNALPNVTPLTSMYEAYIRAGFVLVPIVEGKGPTSSGWNRRENCVSSVDRLNPNVGYGIAHAYSGTMSLDVDNYSEAVAMLAEHRIDLDALLQASDSVLIDSGNPGHAKLLFKLPFGITLPSKKITNDSGSVVYELRCSTSNGLTTQCVLPSAVNHPKTGKPYRWAGNGHFSNLPTIPIELLTIWSDLVTKDSQRTVSNGTIDASWDEIKSALHAVPSECSRDEWVQVGMALQYAGSTTNQEAQAFYLWDEWSSTAPTKYKGQSDLVHQWKSFRALDNGVKLGTLFHIAGQYGWKRPMPDVSALFKHAPQTHIEILESLRTPAPDMDMGLFPPVLRRRAHEVAQSVGCDPIVPLFAGLGAICGAVDARTRLRLMDGFEVPPVLWVMTIGDPAEKKTPGASPMLSVLEQIEKEDLPRQRQDMLAWEALDVAYQASRKSYLTAAAQPEMLLGGMDLSTLPPVAPEPPKAPVPLRLVVQDITSQKLVRIVADRPRGVLCYLDEMSSWVTKVTDPKSGEDRSAWTVGMECKTYTMDRVGEQNSIRAENFAVSIFGNIQPQVYRKAVNAMATDGLLQRFIPGILRPKMSSLNEPIPDMLTNRPEWETLVRQVYALPATTYTLSPAAYDKYREFQAWYDRNKRTERLLESDNTYMQAYGKLEGLTGRVALVLHLMTEPYTLEVSASTMESAVYFVRGYVIPALRYALSEIAGSIEETLDFWVLRHILQISGESETITLGELRRSAKRQLEGMNHMTAHEALRYSMHLLEKAGWVATINETAKRTEWAIYPKLAEAHPAYRLEIIKAKQKQLDDSREIAQRAGHTVARRFARGYDPATMD